MANMKVTGTQANQKTAAQKPQEASQEVKKHLKNINKAGMGENGKDIIKGAAIGGLAGAIALPLLPIGVAVGAAAAAGSGIAAVANKIEEKHEDKQIKDSIKKAGAGAKKTAQKPAAEQDSSKLQSALKTAGAAVIGGAVLGLPGVALGAMLGSDFVTDKAQDAWHSLTDFMTKNGDKMVAKTPGKVE